MKAHQIIFNIIMTIEIYSVEMVANTTTNFQDYRDSHS